MPKYLKYYEDRNCLEVAVERTRKLYQEFDNVLVCFSGGKDSLCVLELCRLVGVNEGYTDKVKVWFRDEEVIHQSVIDFVNEYRQKEWIDMQWWATPLQSHKYLLGKITDYIQWDPERDPKRGGRGWVREKPSWGLDNADLGLPEDKVISQYEGDELAVRDFKGSTVILTGVRAAESLLRHQAIMGAGHRGPDYWLSARNERINTARPIADWAENDTFRFFYDLQNADPSFTYCEVYDAQILSKMQMRVGTVITSEAAKKLDKLAISDPDLFDAVMRIWPEMAVQARYLHDYAPADEAEEWGQDYDSIASWCEANLEGRWLDNARYHIERARSRAELYPPKYLMTAFLKGGYKRTYLAAVIDPAEQIRWGVTPEAAEAARAAYEAEAASGKKRRR